MSEPSSDASSAAAAAARHSYGRLVAFLAARSHDIAAAEDALGDAFAAALAHWPVDGVPDAPEAWLLTTARRRLHDRWRHGRVEAGAEATLRIVFGELPAAASEAAFPDERLKLMFVCAHPAIDPAARPALMLQTVLGLDAARIASAFLVAPATLSQRLVRAKTKIRSAGIAFEVPEAEWADRLGDVLEAVYAAYGTGWDDVAGTDAMKGGLAREAIDLAAMLTSLVPDAAEVWGLLALLAFCQSRAAARRNAAGDYVPLAAQDTALWDRELLHVAERALHRAARLAAPGPFQLEARSSRRTRSAASAPTCPARRSCSSTISWWSASRRSARSSVAPRRSARRAAPRPALPRFAAIDAGALESYQPYWAARAHLEALAGHADVARSARERAIGLTSDPAVRRFLLAAH